jgi:hypothetical protein
MWRQEERWILWVMLCSFFVMGCGTTHLRAGQPTYISALSVPVPAIPQEAERTIPTLAHALTHNKRTGREKSWAIFRWITANIAYDTDAYFSGRYGSTRAEAVLQTRRSVCDGYANLFFALGRSAGLEVVKIYGSAKGAGDLSGTIPRANHAWNAVRFDGQWHLVDSTWGAGVLEGRRFIRRFEPFYFATRPEHAIYSHFPQQKRWQQLSQTLSYQAFLALPKLYPAFFRLGLDPSAYPKAPIHAEAQLRLRLDKPHGLFFMTSLTWTGRTYTKSVYRDGVLHAQLDYPGEYQVMLYASAKRWGTHKAVGQFRVLARGDKRPENIQPVFFRPCWKLTKSRSIKSCKLQTPHGGALPSGKTQSIQVYIPYARKAYAQSRGQHALLHPVPGFSGWFRGKITPTMPGSLTIYASKTKNAPVYQGALSLVVY